MTTPPDGLHVRAAGPTDIPAVARLRRGPRSRTEPAFQQRVAEWLADEDDRGGMQLTPAISAGGGLNHVSTRDLPGGSVEIVYATADMRSDLPERPASQR